MIVEDDTVASIELECILEDLGHRVTAVALTPSSAKAVLAKRAGEIDAVIFGATLVGLPAYALASALARTGLPAAVTSKHPEDFVRVLGFTEAFLPKPYSRANVSRVLAGMQGHEVASAA